MQQERLRTMRGDLGWQRRHEERSETAAVTDVLCCRLRHWLEQGPWWFADDGGTSPHDVSAAGAAR
jgi:hypothetical protein